MKCLPSAHMLAVLACPSILLSGCGGSRPLPPKQGPRAQTLQAFAALDGTRWLWTEVECADGAPAAHAPEFERELRVLRQTDGLLLVHDQRDAQCEETLIDLATPSSRRQAWDVRQQARISVPMSDGCERPFDSDRLAELKHEPGVLELTLFSSAWCKGLDARVVYQRVADAELTDPQLIRHYAAHFNRRDAPALAGLFSDDGSLLEPFTPEDSEVPRRYDGRDAVRQWHARAFASVPWLALRLTRIRASDEAGRYVAAWQYMDAGLGQPLRGRHLFVLASGEIFETELQFITRPMAANSAGAVGGRRSSGSSLSAGGVN